MFTIDSVNTVLSLSLSNDTLLVGEPLTVTAVVNASQGKVLFYINDILNDTVDVNIDGVARLVLDNLYYGGYNVTAVFTDDEGTYLNSSNRSAFSVYSNTVPEVSGWDCDWTVNGNVTLQIRVKDQFGDYVDYGNVTFLIDDKPYTVKLVDSVANKTISFNQAGEHNITVLFNAVTIDSVNTVLSLSLSNDTLLVGEPLTVTAVVNATQGKVLFYINNVLNDTVDVDRNGVAVLTLSNFYYGGYNVTAVFTDDKGTYLNSSNRSAFSVYSNTVPEVSGWDCDWKVNGNVTLQVRVKDQFGDYIDDGDVVFLIDGKAYTVKLVDSVANKTVLFTQVGEHNITVLFNAVDYYYSSNITKLVDVSPLQTALSLSLDEDIIFVDDSLTATAVVNATQGKVSFYINGILNGTVDVDSDGVAVLTLSNLYYGEYNLTAVFSDDEGIYLNSSDKTEFTVFSMTFIEVSGWDCDWTINKNYTLQVRVKNQFGDYIKDGEVFFYIEGDAYTVELVDSVANKTISFTQAGQYDILVIFNTIDYYFFSYVIKLIDIKPVNTVLSLSLSNGTLLVGEPLTATAVVNATQGKVSFYINGVLNDTVGVDSDGVAVLTLNNLKSGDYNITAVFTDDNGTYLNSSDKASFTVIYPIKIITQDLTKYYNESDRFAARIIGYDGKGISNQKVEFTIENTTYESITDSKGYAYLTASLQPGDYIVKTIYEDLEASNLFTILPTLLDKDMNISSSDIYDDESEVINVVLPKDATGNVSTIVNGKKYSADVNKGVANISIPNLKDGNYNIEIIYSGNEKYNSVRGNTSFTVKKSQITISAPDVTKYYRGSERFIVTLKYNDKALNNATISININGMDYKRTTDENGVASMAINLDSGVYNVTVEYNSTKAYSTVTVKSTIVASDITKIFRNGTQYYAKFMDSQGNILKNTDVKFNINGVFYTRTTDEAGIVKLTINLNPGEYILTAINPSNGEQHANTIKVLSSIVENHDLIKYYKNASQFTFRLLDNQGNPVGAGVSAIININGVFYTRTTDANGYITLNINLNPGTYIATIEYNGLSLANTIKVLPILEAKDLRMKYRDGTKFEVKLLDGQGKPYAGQTITLNINGVFYDRITDNAGIARLNINLMPGEYIITSMYKNGAVISNKITISG
ncbi:Ig-like domain-containing protein [uncultured Methanobrevibacter sp.]|uniref:Ig-like domain-containing protein n=1 Tax=uncultured Methanobrevibacter sp. TaxID=253161 RepID=UPI0025CB9804|nr:Ig-like domain-containing protein [uncultured Methanobrevibacter sp.]